jgi:NitT/TauT family transport system ATP-binding protein
MNLELREISKSFATRNGPVQALRDVNLAVNAGEFVCIIGPSGCGKSTLLNVIAGLDNPDEGEILLDGRSIDRPGPDRTLMFQEAALFPWLTVKGNVQFGLRAKKMSREKREALSDEFLRLCHLSKFKNSYVHQLSGGMRQRVALARALVLNPQMLLMDEPFAFLDAQTREMLQSQLQMIWSLTHKAIIFVTHNVREAVCLGDRVLVMTARPGTFKKEFRIDIPRPRRLSNIELIRLSTLLMQELRGEIQKIVGEEYDDEEYPA